MTQAIRRDLPTAYKTTVKRTLVDALRAVFTDLYGEEQFRNLNISTQYPLAEIEYPSIFVRFDEGGIYNAGVGHVEHFYDQSGILREWKHRRYEGEIEFVICALSPLDRDVLSDALIEILSFGSLDPLLAQFGYRIYGDPTEQYTILNALHQISLNTDEIMSGGETQAIAPWEPEDVLVYQTSYTCECHGGFYNTQVQTPVTFISSIDLQGYLYSDPLNPSFDLDAAGLPFPQDGNMWTYPFLYVDEGVVSASSVITSSKTDMVVLSAPSATATGSVPAPIVALGSLFLAPFAQAAGNVPRVQEEIAIPAVATAGASVPPVSSSIVLPTSSAAAASTQSLPVIEIDEQEIAPSATAAASAGLPSLLTLDSVTLSPAPALAAAAVPAVSLLIDSTISAPVAGALAKAPTPNPFIPLITAAASVPLPTVQITLLPSAVRASANVPLSSVRMSLLPASASATGLATAVVAITTFATTAAFASIPPPTVRVSIGILPNSLSAVASAPAPSLTLLLAPPSATSGAATVSPIDPAYGRSVTPGVTLMGGFGVTILIAIFAPPAAAGGAIPVVSAIRSMLVPSPAASASTNAGTTSLTATVLGRVVMGRAALGATIFSSIPIVEIDVFPPAAQGAAATTSVSLAIRLLPPSAQASATTTAPAPAAGAHAVLGLGVMGTIVLGKP